MREPKVMSQGGEEDLMSKLPDELAGKILSYLTIKKALQTSIVSRNWRYLWTYMSKFEFFYEDFTRLEDFMNFVDQVLVLLLRQGKSIEEWKVTFRNSMLRQSDLRRINNWINNVLSCNVKKFVLDIPHETPRLETSGLDRLPDSFSSCKTLEVLHLGIGFNFRVPLNVNFPNLKVLKFRARSNYKFLNNLFCRCPKLEELSTYSYFFESQKFPIEHTFRISVPTLTRLEIIFQDISAKGDKFIIQTPKLKYLSILHDILPPYEIAEMPSDELEVELRLGNNPRSQKEDEDRLMPIFNRIRHVKSLTIGPTFTGLRLYDDLPIFLFLRHLELMIPSWQDVPPFLTNAYFLQSLVLKKHFYVEYSELTRWIPPRDVPRCLLQHLKEIKIGDLRRCKDDVKVVEYFLENGKVLEKMCIKLDAFRSVEEINEEEEIYEDMIENFQRASEKCIIEFNKKKKNFD